MKSIHVAIDGTTPIGENFHKDMYFTVGKYPKSAFNHKSPKRFTSQGKVASIQKTGTKFYVEFNTGHGLPFKDENVEVVEEDK